MAFVCNYLLKDFGSEPWRWMIGMEALPAFIYCLLIFLIPESLGWLITIKDNVEKAIPTLKVMDPNTDVGTDC